MSQRPVLAWLVPLAAIAAASSALADQAVLTGSVPRQEARPDSNMGFRMETSFPARPERANDYLLAMPGFPGEADIADAAAMPPCSEPSAPRTDGVIDAVDLLCELWTSRGGGMTASRWVDAAGTWQHRSIVRDDATGDVIVSGDWVDPVVSGEALLIHVTAPATGLAANDAVITGSHDPALNCLPVSHFALYNVFYHTMFMTADEVLCGLAGVAWADGDGDGNPDTCAGAMFEAADGGFASVSALQDPRTSTGAVLTRVVTADPSAPGGVRFSGVNFALGPPDACIVTRSVTQQPAAPCQPHF